MKKTQRRKQVLPLHDVIPVYSHYYAYIAKVYPALVGYQTAWD